MDFESGPPGELLTIDEQRTLHDINGMAVEKEPNPPRQDGGIVELELRPFDLSDFVGQPVAMRSEFADRDLIEDDGFAAPTGLVLKGERQCGLAIVEFHFPMAAAPED